MSTLKKHLLVLANPNQRRSDSTLGTAASIGRRDRRFQHLRELRHELGREFVDFLQLQLMPVGRPLFERYKKESMVFGHADDDRADER